MPYAERFSYDQLAELVKEAESLNQFQDDAMAMLRQAIVADEATAQIIMALDSLLPEEMTEVRQKFDAKYPGMWEKYEQNPRRVKQILGKELYEAEMEARKGLE